MTALLAVPQENCIHLLSDGALYTPDGVMTAIGIKAFGLPKASAALAVRGPHHRGEILAKELGGFSSFDGLVEDAPRALLIAANDEASEGETLIVGFSETRGPEAWFCARDGQLSRSSWGDYFAAAPEPDRETFAEVGFVPWKGPDDFHPIRDGVPLMEAFRQTRDRMGDVEMYGVGGFVAHTLIGAGSVTTEIIHIWPDVLGEPIDPTRKGFSMQEFRQLQAETGLKTHSEMTTKL